MEWTNEGSRKVGQRLRVWQIWRTMSRGRWGRHKSKRKACWMRGKDKDGWYKQRGENGRGQHLVGRVGVDTSNSLLLVMAEAVVIAIRCWLPLDILIYRSGAVWFGYCKCFCTGLIRHANRKLRWVPEGSGCREGADVVASSIRIQSGRRGDANWYCYILVWNLSKCWHCKYLLKVKCCYATAKSEGSLEQRKMLYKS